MSRRDLNLRFGIFAGAGGLLLLFLVSMGRTPVQRFHSINEYPEQRVRLSWGDKFVEVQIDERSEKVPVAEVERSAIFREAMRRIPRDNRPESSEVRWRQVFRVWLPVMAVLWVLLFRLWQPLRSYVEGGPVK